MNQRGWPEEAEAKEKVEDRYGDALDAMAELRNRAYEELKGGQISTNSLHGHRAYLLLIFTRAIGGFDAVRILAEHAYTEEAFGLTRLLYELEIDAFLLATGTQEYLDLYADYERWELAITAAKGLQHGLVAHEDEGVEQAVDGRIQDLVDGLSNADIEVPEGFSELGLDEAAMTFAKERFRHRYPNTWRPHDGWDEILAEVAPAQIRLIEPEVEAGQPDRFAKLTQARIVEHRFSHALMSAVLHGSPRSIASRQPEFRVSGDIDEVPKVVGVAAVHFSRLHHLVVRELEIPSDMEAWVDGLRRCRGM